MVFGANGFQASKIGSAYLSIFAFLMMLFIVLGVIGVSGAAGESQVAEAEARTYRPLPMVDQAPGVVGQWNLDAEQARTLSEARPRVPDVIALTTTPAPGENSNRDSPPFVPVDASTGVHSCSLLDFKSTYLRESEAPSECPSGQEKIGFLCYQTCPNGWTQNDAFPNTCGRCKDYSSTCDYLSMMYTNKVKTGVATECKPGSSKWGGLCFKQCQNGYTSQGNICIKCLN